MLNALLFAIFQGIQATDNEKAVYNALFASYDQDIRPIPPNYQTYVTNVTLTMNYMVLLTLDQKGELMSFSADVQKSWYDPNLSWNPLAYGNVSRILSAERSLWRPDIAIVNGAAEDDVIPASDRYAVIFSDGTVQLSAPAVYTTRCLLTLSSFPFDSQECEIRFGSWVYTLDEILLVAQDYVLEPGAEYKGNSEWTVENITAYNYVDHSDSGNDYGELHYTIKLKRKSNYYIYVLFLPTFVVSTLAIFGLFTPLNNEGDRAEKATLGLTTLLSLAVMLDIVGQDMPKSAPLPRLGRYVLGEIIICSLGVLASIALQIAHQRINTREFIPSKSLAKKTFEKFPKSEPCKMGMRVLRSAGDRDFKVALGELECSLQKVCEYIAWLELKEEFYTYWIRLFDVIDLLLLLLFQAANVILTAVIVLF